MKNLLQQLGYYDFSGRSYVMNIFDIPDEYLDVEMHEKVHAQIANRSILGYLTILVQKARLSSTHNSHNLEQVFNSLVSKSRLIHEGTATYTEYLLASARGNQKQFLRNLENLGVYRDGYTIAKLIDKVLTPKRLTDIPSSRQNFIKSCVLTDIARFAFNIPILTYLQNSKESNLAQAIEIYLEKNNPTLRWMLFFTT